MIDDVQMRQNYITLSFSIFKFQNKRHCWVAPLLGEKNLTQHRQFHSVSITIPLSLPLDTYPYIYLYMCVLFRTLRALSHFVAPPKDKVYRRRNFLSRLSYPALVVQLNPNFIFFNLSIIPDPITFFLSNHLSYILLYIKQY